MARNKRLSHSVSNKLFAAKAKYTKRINKQTSINRPGGTRM